MLMTQDPVRNPSVLQQKPWNATIMCPQYTFDSANTLTFLHGFINGGVHFMVILNLQLEEWKFDW